MHALHACLPLDSGKWKVGQEEADRLGRTRQTGVVTGSGAWRCSLTLVSLCTCACFLQPHLSPSSNPHPPTLSSLSHLPPPSLTTSSALPACCVLLWPSSHHLPPFLPIFETYYFTHHNISLTLQTLFIFICLHAFLCAGQHALYHPCTNLSSNTSSYVVGSGSSCAALPWHHAVSWSLTKGASPYTSILLPVILPAPACSAMPYILCKHLCLCVPAAFTRHDIAWHTSHPAILWPFLLHTLLFYHYHGSYYLPTNMPLHSIKQQHDLLLCLLLLYSFF